MRRIVMAASAICVLAVATGCASKTKERLNVALAENTDLRQRQADIEAQYATIAQENDRAQAEVQRKQTELAAAQQRAAEGAAFQMEAQRLQTSLAAAEARQTELQRKMDAN